MISDLVLLITNFWNVTKLIVRIRATNITIRQTESQKIAVLFIKFPATLYIINNAENPINNA